MPLESLNNEQINIHDLTLEQEKKPEPEAEKLYEVLKETPLYDIANKQWNDAMNEKQTVNRYKRHAQAQLLGILAQSQFDGKGAKEQYNKLKTTALYDGQKDQWISSMKSNQTILDLELPSEAQLTSVLVEAKFDREEAQKHFEKLRNSAFYDKKKKQWCRQIAPFSAEDNSTCYSKSQLLGIIVQAQFDKEKAEEEFNTLKNGPLYDSEKQQWNFNVVVAYSITNFIRFAFDQLLGVLAEFQFNRAAAREQYQQLKETPLYDCDLKQWNYSMGFDQTAGSSERAAENQLIGVLCEAEFEKDQPHQVNQVTPDLPETRKY